MSPRRRKTVGAPAPTELELAAGPAYDEAEQADPFPLLEETSDPAELPTASEWLAAGAPMRHVLSYDEVYPAGDATPPPSGPTPEATQRALHDAAAALLRVTELLVAQDARLEALEDRLPPIFTEGTLARLEALEARLAVLEAVLGPSGDGGPF